MPIMDDVRDPILRGRSADPSVVRVGATFHLITGPNESVPGFALFTSTDLSSWTPVEAVLADDAASLGAAASSRHMPSATIRHDGARFVVASTMVGGGHLLTVADEIGGPWSVAVILEGDGRDPSLVFEDGRAWLTWSAEHAVHCREIDPGTGATIGNEHELWRGTGDAAPEGAHVYRVGSWWYLLVADGGTGSGHGVSVARSREPTGPFAPCQDNPVLSSCVRDGTQDLGRFDLVQAGDGTWWALVGGGTSVDPGDRTRAQEWLLVPVWWVAGWPVFGDPRPGVGDR